MINQNLILPVIQLATGKIETIANKYDAIVSPIVIYLVLAPTRCQ